jgi:predicted permease
MFHYLRQDLKYAARSLWHARAFTATIVLTLAVGIGATSAMFSIINAAWFKAPPYPEPERLVLLATPLSTSQTGQLFLYLRERLQSFERMAAQSGGNGWTIDANGRITYARALVVSDGYFAVHGVGLAAGREFAPREAAPGGPNVVVISESLARDAFRTSGAAVGRTIALGETPYVVVGVAPGSFTSIPRADIWTPLRTSLTDNSRNYDVIARLRAEITRSQANAELDVVQPDILREFPRSNARQLGVTRWTPFRQARVGNLREPLLLLLGAVAFLLLLACINVASLQLTRALQRRRELATRAALGGTLGRLIRFALAESLLLAIGGALAGLVIAEALPRLVVAFVSEPIAEQLFGTFGPAVDWRVVAFAAGLAGAAALIFGVAPAIISSRTDLREAIADAVTTTASRKTIWVRRWLAATQVALACVLLVGAGLLVRTLVNLYGSDVGFRSTGIVVGRMVLQGTGNAMQFESFLNEAIERARRTPGIDGVAISNSVPIERAMNLPLQPPAGSQVAVPRAVDWRYVTSGYFDVFGVPVLAGRAFDARDRVGSRPVAVVNEAFARAYFGRTNVVGETIALVPAFRDDPREIVGVVGDAKGRSGSGWTQGLTAVGSAAAPTVYHPAGQAPMIAQAGQRTYSIALSVRTTRAPAAVADGLRAAARAADPRAVFISFERMDDVLARDLELPRLVAVLLSAFSAIGVLLAGVGLYGLMAHDVSQRTREIGIRMALGATTSRLLRRVVSEGVLNAAAGILVGAAAAAVMSRTLTGWLFGVTSLDLGTFATVAVLLVGVAVLATFMPALRAARIDAADALRAG